MSRIDDLRKRRHKLMDTQSRAQKLELLSIKSLQSDRSKLVSDLEEKIKAITKQIHDLQPPEPKDVLGTMVDVSSWQGSVDWSKMAAAGIKVASVKVDEGVGAPDPTFSGARLDAIHKAGLAGAGYHFARPDSVGTIADAQAEARSFVGLVKQAGGKFVNFADWRDGGTGVYGWLDFEHTPYSAWWAAAWAGEFKKETGVQPGAYGGGYSLNPIAAIIPDHFSTIWIAAYANSWQPYLVDSLEHLVQFWQYTSTASLGGETNIDVSRYLG